MKRLAEPSAIVAMPVGNDDAGRSTTVFASLDLGMLTYSNHRYVLTWSDFGFSALTLAAQRGYLPINGHSLQFSI